MRNNTDKPQEKLTSGLVLQAMITSLQSPNGDFSKTLESNLQTALEALPYDQVQDSLKSSKGTYEIITEPLLLGGLSAGVDPVMQTGTISQGVAGQPSQRSLCRAVYSPKQGCAACGVHRRRQPAHHGSEARHLAGRDIALAPPSSPLSPKLHPVLVASGTAALI